MTWWQGTHRVLSGMLLSVIFFLVKTVVVMFPKSGTACCCVCSHPNVEQLFCASLDRLLLHSSYSDLQGFCCSQLKVNLEFCILLGCVAASYVSRQCSDLIFKGQTIQEGFFIGILFLQSESSTPSLNIGWQSLSDTMPNPKRLET
jgi:hypothetical protein